MSTPWVPSSPRNSPSQPIPEDVCLRREPGACPDPGGSAGSHAGQWSGARPQRQLRWQVGGRSCGKVRSSGPPCLRHHRVTTEGQKRGAQRCVEAPSGSRADRTAVLILKPLESEGLWGRFTVLHCSAFCEGYIFLK